MSTISRKKETRSGIQLRDTIDPLFKDTIPGFSSDQVWRKYIINPIHALIFFYSTCMLLISNLTGIYIS